MHLLEHRNTETNPTIYPKFIGHIPFKTLHDNKDVTT